MRAHRRTRFLFPTSLGIREAAKVSRLSVAKLKQRINDGTIPAYIAENGRKLVLVADLVAYIRTLPSVSNKEAPHV
jgi:hypothetical protein